MEVLSIALVSSEPKDVPLLSGDQSNSFCCHHYSPQMNCCIDFASIFCREVKKIIKKFEVINYFRLFSDFSQRHSSNWNLLNCSYYKTTVCEVGLRKPVNVLKLIIPSISVKLVSCSQFETKKSTRL